MKKDLTCKEREVQDLRNRVRELERQLAETQDSVTQQRVEELHAIIQALHDPVMVYDQDGVISLANASAIRAHGFDPTGHHRRDTNRTLMVRYPDGRVVHSDDLPSARALKGETVVDEAVTIVNSDGQELGILVTSSPLFLNGVQKGAVSVWHDVTEQKNVEKTLRESERRQREIARALELDQARLAAVLQHLPVGIWIVDQQGRLIGNNAEADRIWAGEAPLLNGINEYQKYVAWHPEGGELLKPEEYPVAIALRTGEPVNPMEIKIRRFDGSEGTILVSAAPIRDNQGLLTGVVGVNVDITERRQAEERFNKAFHASPNALVISHQEDGRIETVNATFIKFFGYPAEEVIGKTSVELGMFVNLADRQEAVRRLQRDKTIRDFELDVRLKSGEVRSVSLSVELMNIGSKDIMLTTIQDVTKRKRAEEALRESEERFRAVVENALDAIVVTDPSQGGAILSVNPAACRMFGYSAEEFLGLDREAMLDRDDPRLAIFLEQRDSRGRITGELTYKRKNGERFSGELSSVFFQDRNGERRAVAIIRDITERKQAEEALRESEERYRGLFETMREGLVAAEVITDENGTAIDYRYLDVNPATERQFGIPRENFIGRTYTQVLPAGDREWIDIFGQVAHTGEPLSLERYGKASKRWFECHVYSPRPGQVVNITTDITERKKAEEALRQSEERFAKAFRASPNAIVLSRLSDGLILEVNDGWITIFGHKPNEVIGRTTLELGVYANPEDRQVALARLKEKGSLRDVEVQIRRKSGEVRQASMSAERMEINGEEYLLVILRDITEQKQAEHALRESEARYRGLLESQLDLIVRVDPEGRFTFVNDAYCQKFGLRREDVLGQANFQPLVHPEDLPHTLEAMKALYQPPYRATMEQRAFTVEGVRWIEWQDSAIRDETGTILEIQAIGRDITARKRAVEALRESEERLERAQEIAHLGSWELNLVTNQLTWSDEVYRIFGLQPQEFDATYEAFLAAVHPEDRAAVDAAYSGSIQAGKHSYEIEHRVVKRSNGEIRIVHEKCEHFQDENGQIVRSIGMVHDITERKQAERALQESEERFHSLADSMPQLVWTALRDGTVDYYNQRYKEYREIKQMQEDAWDWAPVLHPDDLRPTIDAWYHSVETGEIYQIEHRVRMADGSYRWHLSRGMPTLDEEGRVTRWFGTATDIHDLKLAEEQSKLYAERLEQSNRELEQFAFMASHDLQEPLRKIEVFGDLLLESSRSLNGRERNYLERMRSAARRMHEMVEGLLQLSRVTTQAKPFVRVDLSGVTSEVLHDLEGQVDRVSGRVDIGALPVIEGDPLQLRQLMQNLIGNALKYHPADKPPEVKIRANQLSGKVQILVEDQGIGFEQKDAERIFQPFQRLVGRSQYEGSGIGLAICRRIVERHRGEIVARSQPGQGATVIVTLPTHHPESVRDELRKDLKDEKPGIALGR